MFRRSFHYSRTIRSSTKVWANFSSRPESLSIASEPIRKCILEGTPKQGPPTIGRRSNRIKYTSPAKIDEVFATCYDFLQLQAAAKYAELSQEQDPKKRTELAVEAEMNNPEVLYNFQFSEKRENNPRLIDYNLPVYRHLGRKHWESYGQMLLMQRLETLAVIPDTLPTLVPRADVSIRFPFSTGVNRWIEPGDILSSNATSMAPTIKIQEFDDVNTEKQLYTILIVNPDEPDLASDSFKTTLSYGLVDLKVKYNDNIIDPRKFSKEQVIANYLPPVPEKNTGKHRYSVWVFRQKYPYSNEITFDRENFNIREFVKKQKLDPIGAHVWRSEWDSNVANIRDKYGLAPGRVFHRVRR
ncbi:LAFE_0D07030g1_1 [Lachancea fermentati]|uniref:Large ribosomal subunit protein mL38 n=1 Tax=Lachancea fermentati TaxID=4955 RepID=A0A1G4MBB0_LACFM|nr:LAFE_0D07030g1_1 [Lachancea fermentati]